MVILPIFLSCSVNNFKKVFLLFLKHGPLMNVILGLFKERF